MQDKLNMRKRIWRVPYGAVVEPGAEEHLVESTAHEMSALDISKFYHFPGTITFCTPFSFFSKRLNILEFSHKKPDCTDKPEEAPY